MQVLASEPEELRRIFEGRPDGLPVFEDPRVPCVQCVSITIGFEDETRVTVHTAIFDFEWGLIVTDFEPVATEPELDRDPYSIYRKATLDHFPAGPISRVTVNVSPDSGHILAFSIEFERGAITLLAGEFDEHWDGSIRLLLDDESILFFPNGDGLAWAKAKVSQGHIRPLWKS